MTDSVPAQPSTDVVPQTSAPPAVLTEAGQRWADAWRLAQRISKTEFVPRSFQGRPEAVLAAILYGDELGLGPMQALRNIHVIEGKVGASPELMRGMVARAGHRIEFVEYTDTKVTLRGTRIEGGVKQAPLEVTWTIADAERAGLLKIVSGKVVAKSSKGGALPWEAYTRAMLLARASSELCRANFADVIGGLSYTPEEIAGPGYDAEEAPTDPLTQKAEPVKAWESDIEDADLVPDEDIPEARQGGAKKRPEYGGDAEMGPDEVEDLVDADKARVTRTIAEADRARTGRAMDEGRLV